MDEPKIIVSRCALKAERSDSRWFAVGRDDPSGFLAIYVDESGGQTE